MKCDFCPCYAVDSMEFEAGNNAEIPVSVDLCENHLEAAEADCSAFERTHGGRLDELAYQRHFERYAR